MSGLLSGKDKRNVTCYHNTFDFDSTSCEWFFLSPRQPHNEVVTCPPVTTNRISRKRWRDVWMDGWMDDGWMHGWMDGWMDG